MVIFSIINHKGSHCNSSQLVKGILSDNSTGVFRGLTHVKNGAEKTNAKQANHNLLLSSKARMNSIPQLEIYEDDVKCTHGSTTGQIDKNLIFYLRSRGIKYEDAIQLMLNGFANEIIDKIKNNRINTYVNNILQKKIQQEII